MVRPLRVEYADALDHVMSGGNERRRIVGATRTANSDVVAALQRCEAGRSRPAGSARCDEPGVTNDQMRTDPCDV